MNDTEYYETYFSYRGRLIEICNRYDFYIDTYKNKLRTIENKKNQLKNNVTGYVPFLIIDSIILAAYIFFVIYAFLQGINIYFYFIIIFGAIILIPSSYIIFRNFLKNLIQYHFYIGTRIYRKIIHYNNAAYYKNMLDYYTQLIITKCSEKNRYERILTKIRNEETISEKEKLFIQNFNEKNFDDKIPYKNCKLDGIDFFMNIFKKGEHIL
jgi:hypothetical protein